MSLETAVELIKAGEPTEARPILISFLQENRYHEQAWLYLAACAENKAEFEATIQHVLRLNPLNSQALKLAEQNKLKLPADLRQAIKKAKKKPRTPPGETKGGGGRLLLLVLLLISIGGGALFVVLGRGGEPVAVVEPTATPSPTASATATATPTLEPTPEPTEEIAEEAELAVTRTPRPTRTPAPPSPEPETEEIAAVDELPIFDDPADYFLGLQVLSGRSASPAELTFKTQYLSDEALNVVIQITAHGEPLDFLIQLQPQNAGIASRVETTFTAEPGDAREIVIPIEPSGGTWRSDTWSARLQINGVSVQGAQFSVLRGDATTAAPPPPPPQEEIAEEVATEEPAEETPAPTLKLVYNPSALYIINLLDTDQDISALRFVQEPDITFAALEWQEGNYKGPGSVYALPPESCFQVGIDTRSASPKPAECLRLSAWRSRGAENQFWVAGATTFNIFLNDELIQSCEIAAEQCEFALPE